MAELVREVVIDASPSTIFPFLTDSTQHVLWMGTEAQIEARPGGTYRVLAQGVHPGVGTFVEVVPNLKVVFTLVGTNPTIQFLPVQPKWRLSYFPRVQRQGCGSRIEDFPTMRWRTTPMDGISISIACRLSRPAATPARISQTNDPVFLTK